MKTQLNSDEICDLLKDYVKQNSTDWRINLNNLNTTQQMYFLNFIKLYVKKI